MEKTAKQEVDGTSSDSKSQGELEGAASTRKCEPCEGERDEMAEALWRPMQDYRYPERKQLL